MLLWQYLISHHIKSAVFIQTSPTSVNDPSTLLPSPTHILARGSLLSFYKRSTSTQEVASADICESNYSSAALIHRFWWFFYCVLWDNLSSLQGVCCEKGDRIRSNHGKVTFKSHTVEQRTLDLRLANRGTNRKMLNFGYCSRSFWVNCTFKTGLITAWVRGNKAQILKPS